MRIKSLVLTIFLSLVTTTVAETLTGRAVMQKVYDQAHIHHTQKASVFMVIVDEKNEKRTLF